MTAARNFASTTTIGAGWYQNQLQLIEDMTASYLEIALEKAERDDIEGCVMTLTKCITAQTDAMARLKYEMFGA